MKDILIPNIFDIDMTKYCKYCNPLRLRRSHAECVFIDNNNKKYYIGKALNQVSQYREPCEDNCINKNDRMNKYIEAMNRVIEIKKRFNIPI